MGMSDPVSTPQSTSAHHITEDICDIKTVQTHWENVLRSLPDCIIIYVINYEIKHLNVLGILHCTDATTTVIFACRCTHSQEPTYILSVHNLKSIRLIKTVYSGEVS